MDGPHEIGACGFEASLVKKGNQREAWMLASFIFVKPVSLYLEFA